MIIKISGVVIIMASCIMWGIYMSSKEYFRLKDLREMKRAYLVLHSEIDYGMNQLAEAASNVSQKCAFPIREIFETFSYNVKGNINVLDIWEEAIESVFEASYFLPEDKEVFKSFGKTLGYMDKQMQINSIDMQIDYIDDKISMLESSWIKSRKMYLSLGILGAMAIGLLMI